MPPAFTSSVSSETKFCCALCNKSFERRDLRDRHRRRCERSIVKGQVPKKKSCQSCSRSKVKCDLQLPACQRCANKHAVCEYPVASTPAMLSAIQDESGTTDVYVTPPASIHGFPSSGLWPETGPSNGMNHLDWSAEMPRDTTSDVWDASHLNDVPDLMPFPANFPPQDAHSMQGTLLSDLPLPLHSSSPTAVSLFSDNNDIALHNSLKQPNSPRSSGTRSVSLEGAYDTRSSSLSRPGSDLAIEMETVYPIASSQTGSLHFDEALRQRQLLQTTSPSMFNIVPTSLPDMSYDPFPPSETAMKGLV